MLSYSLSLVSLALRLFPFISSLKLYQSALLIAAQKPFTSEMHLITAGLTTEKSKILLAIPVLEPHIDQLGLSDPGQNDLTGLFQL